MSDPRIVTFDKSQSCCRCDHASICEVYGKLALIFQDGTGAAILRGVSGVYVAIANVCLKFKEATP